MFIEGFSQYSTAYIGVVRSKKEHNYRMVLKISYSPTIRPDSQIQVDYMLGYI